MLNYRRANSSDIPDLTKLRLEFLREVSGNDIIENEILNSEIFKYFETAIPENAFVSWLCLNNDKIVATSGLSFYQVPPSNSNLTGKIAYIMNMYTLPVYRKQGIASVLFEKIIHEAKQTDAGKLVLHATESGRNLYSRYGFEMHNGEMILSLKD